jgi:hypothetical protein
VGSLGGWWHDLGGDDQPVFIQGIAVIENAAWCLSDRLTNTYLVGRVETVGAKLYRWVLREYGHANQPHLVRDIQEKKKILDVLESATRGLRRMEAVLDRVPEQQVSALLAKLQAPPLNEIADMPTLVQVVQALESIVNGSHPSAA